MLKREIYLHLQGLWLYITALLEIISPIYHSNYNIEQRTKDTQRYYHDDYCIIILFKTLSYRYIEG